MATKLHKKIGSASYRDLKEGSRAEIQDMDVPAIKEALQSAKEYAVRYIETGLEE